MGRRRKGEPPRYWVHPTRGQAVVCVDGKRIYIGRHGTQEAKDRYQEIVRQWQRDHPEEQFTPAAPSTCTVGELVAAFMVHAQQHYQVDGEQTSEVRSFKLSLAPLLGERYARLQTDEFDVLMLDAIRTEMIGRKLGRKTINQHIGRIRRCFRWGVSKKLVRPETAMALGTVADLQEGRSPAPDYEEVAPVPLRHLAKTLRELGRHYAAIARLQYYCGARPGEVCRMRGEEINQKGIAKIKGRSVFVREGVWVFQPRRSKTKQKVGTIIYLLGPRAQQVLKPFLRDDPKEFIFQAREVREERYAAMRAARKTPVQPSQLSRAKVAPQRLPSPHISVTTYTHAIQDAAERAALKDGLKADAYHWSPHQLRHNFLTKADRIAGVETASKAVGHRSIDTTLIYIQKNLDEAGEYQARHG